MTVRRPVYWDGTSIVSLTEAQVTSIKQRCVYLYGSAYSQASFLEYVGSGGNLRRIKDTRDTAGAHASGASDYPSGAAVTDRGASDDYDRINWTVQSPSDPGDPSNIAYPLYEDGGDLRAMSQDDMYDTFINDAIDLLVDGNDRDGTFTIRTAFGYGDQTLVGPGSVFIDQRFNASGVHGNATGTVSLEILPGQATDQPVVHQNYYLNRVNQGTSFGNPTVVQPLYYGTNGDLKTYTLSAWDTILTNLLIYSATQRSPYRIRYEVQGVSGFDTSTIDDFDNSGVGTVGAPRGDAVTDTTLNASVRVLDKDGEDAYRVQRFPTGSQDLETTYRLKIWRY